MTLRRRAEARLQSLDPSLTAAEPVSEASLRQLVHELRIHQLELEMQNEELAAAAQVGGPPLMAERVAELKQAEAARQASEALYRAERNRAEQELRGSHALLERAEQMAQFGNWELNLATRKIRGSLGAKRIYGLLADEWTLEEVQGCVLPECRQLLDRALDELIRDQQPYNVQFRIKRPADGMVRDLHSIAEYDASQQVVFGVISDVTQRHRLEAALETRVLALARPVAPGAGLAFEELFNLEEIQRLQDSFAQATGVAAIITRPDGTPLTRPSQFTRLCHEIIRATPAGCLNCCKSDAAIGRPRPDGPSVQRCLSGGLWDAGTAIRVGGQAIAHWLIGQVRDPAQPLAAMAAYAREIGADEQAFLAALAEVPVMPEAQFHKVADALFSLASHLSASAEQNVQQAGLLAEHRLAEARIRRMAEGLERRVKERTVQLESANQDLEAFSYSVSHDLRAPLRGIDGFSEALLADCGAQLDASGRHYLSRIRLAAQRMGQLIDDLLALSRIGRSDLNLEMVDLSSLAGQVLEELALAHPERRVARAVQPALRLWADPRLLRVMLENLLGNAWKFTARRPDARIEVGGPDLPGGVRGFFIRDNGAGFDLAHAGKLFQPFQRLHAANDFEGTGIGLAIVARVVGRHGGRIWADAEPGQGATFCCTLPDPL